MVIIRTIGLLLAEIFSKEVSKQNGARVVVVIWFIDALVIVVKAVVAFVVVVVVAIVVVVVWASAFQL